MLILVANTSRNTFNIPLLGWLQSDMVLMSIRFIIIFILQPLGSGFLMQQSYLYLSLAAQEIDSWDQEQITFLIGSIKHWLKYYWWEHTMEGNYMRWLQVYGSSILCLKCHVDGNFERGILRANQMCAFPTTTAKNNGEVNNTPKIPYICCSATLFEHLE